MGNGQLLQKDLQNICSEVMRATNENFTGKMTITLDMRKGGIGQISLILEKNLKDLPNMAKNKKI
jgi:hypothetical protein